MDIAVIGPRGSVGRQIVQQIVAQRLLQCEQRLVLVANPGGASARSVFGLVADLQDAYGDIAPRMEVVLDPRDLKADLIVVAAGTTPAASGEDVPMTRDALATRNAPIFRQHAQAIASHGSGHEIVVCVSNPNELAVALFAQHLGRRRVIGMGAYLDSTRFREAIASDLSVPRQHIHAFVAGEHGVGLVPLWSTVHVYGLAADEQDAALRRIRQGLAIDGFPAAISSAIDTVKPLIAAGKTEEAYRIVDRHPPDVRVAVRPFVTHYSGAKTVIGTACATMDLLRAITQGNDALISGQIALDGEVYGIRGTIGVPFVVGNQGVDRVFELSLTTEERRQLCDCAAAIREKTEPFL